MPKKPAKTAKRSALANSEKTGVGRSKNNLPPLIFIHGFRGNHAGLTEVAAEFPDHKVYVPDIPPFGNAGALPAYTPDAYADFVAKFIRSHRLKRPILIGHSMGSIIAAATAAKYPQLINQKLVLMAPISTKPPRPIAMLQPLVTIFPNSLISHITTRFLFVPKNEPKLYRHALDLTKKAGAQYASKADLGSSCRFSARYCIADFDLSEQDVLLLAGAHDRLIARRRTERLADNIGAEAKFIKNTGHLLNYENPAGAARAIRYWLSAQ